MYISGCVYVFHVLGIYGVLVLVLRKKERWVFWELIWGLSFCKFGADLCVLGVYFFFQEVERDACVVRNPGGVCPVQSFG